MEEKKAPEPSNTIEKILETLNSNGETAWIHLDGIFALSAPEIENNRFDFTKTKTGISVSVFVNTRTQEYRFYAAKFLNEAGREALF